MQPQATTPETDADKEDFVGLTIADLVEQPTVYKDELLQDKTIVISGGGSGMGRAMAVLGARLGANVVICGRREERLKEVQASVKDQLGVTIDYRPLTIRDPDQVDDFVEHVFKSHGPVHTVINSAGGQFSQEAIDFSRKGWLAVVDTNLNGTWWMMQAAARAWRDQGVPGNIINIVATVERGMPQSAHSCAARAGVIYLSKTVSTEWAPYKIRVNCIAPGAIKSEGVSQYPEEALKVFAQSNPMKRFGDVWDIAEGAIYLTADTSKFITGEVLTIDGGMSQYGWVWPIGKPDYFKD